MHNITKTALFCLVLGTLCLAGCGHKDDISNQSHADQVKAFQGDSSKVPPQYRHMATPSAGAPAGAPKK